MLAENWPGAFYASCVALSSLKEVKQNNQRDKNRQFPLTSCFPVKNQPMEREYLDLQILDLFTRASQVFLQEQSDPSSHGMVRVSCYKEIYQRKGLIVKKVYQNIL
jgi:hypothetical protein